MLRSAGTNLQGCLSLMGVEEGEKRGKELPEADAGLGVEGQELSSCTCCISTADPPPPVCVCVWRGEG